MFKLFATFLCAALGSTVLAQDIDIALPKSNANVAAGSEVIVKLDKPMILTGSEEVTIVIAAFPCTYKCPGANEVLGDVLYNGPYNPEIHSDDWNPYQNITVTIPSWYNGLVQLGVARFYLLGAGLSAELQLIDTTLNVA